MSGKLWGGRFDESQSQSAQMISLNSSLPVDKRLFEQDIHASIEYAKSLKFAGILTTDELEKMISGLEAVRKEWRETGFVGGGDPNVLEEDVHSVNERRLGELVGTEISGKLHTGRSRNDQVVTDVKLWLKMVCFRK